MKEYRSFGVTAVMAGDEGKITGLAAPFNSETMIGEAPWGFREKISPGAFAKTIQEADVVLLANHDTAKPLARKSAGTLALRESDRGLEIEASPAGTTYAQDVVTNIKAGNIRGMSFGFEVVKEAWFDDDGKVSDKFSGTHRELREIKLIEVSAVTFPAYETTDISARDAVNAARDAEARKSAKDEGKKSKRGEDKKRETRLRKSTKKRIPQIDADLRAAMDLLTEADTKSLPEKVQQAIALVSSAATHSQHVMAHEGLTGGDAAARSVEPDATSTPEAKSDDNALMDAFMDAMSRGIALGL